MHIQLPRGQEGYTLIEVIITVAIGAILMTGLSSVVLTSVRAGNVASSRVEASSQVRSFEFFAYDDFARSVAPDSSGCGTPPWTCPIVLIGTQASNDPVPVLTKNFKVTYAWDGTDILDRTVGSNPPFHAATNVTGFTWSLDTSAAAPTVVVNLTITVQAYTESQTLRFYPRVSQ